MKRLFLPAFIAVVVALSIRGRPAVDAQTRMSYPVVSQTSGHVALGLALRRLTVSATFMQTAAHPDDEHNALYALFTRGMGFRSIDVQTTRGDGGQNEIGPELFRDIAVLRTSELLSAHRLDGAEQYFTRAIDYGYSFDPQEVIDKWGRDAIVGDFARLIRTFRPDVVLTMNIQGGGGDRAHEATTILTREAFRAAADPNRYPEQIKEGLRPWQAAKLYETPPFAIGMGRGAAPQLPPNVTRPNTAAYDPLLGRTYAEIGTDARSNHKCQGMTGLPQLPGFPSGRGFPGAGAYILVDSTIPGQSGKDETSFFDGIDTSLRSIARFAGPAAPAPLAAALGAIENDGRQAQKVFDSGDDAGTAAPIAAGLTAVRTLSSQLGSMGLSDSARYEIDFRLKTKERDYEDALLAAHGLMFDAVADDGLVIAGQPVKLSILAANRGSADVAISDVQIAGFSGQSACRAGAIRKDAVYTCAAETHVPDAAALTTPYFSDSYWHHGGPAEAERPEKPAIDVFAPDVPFGVPFRPTPFHVTFHVNADGTEVTKDVPVQFRYVRDIYVGDKRMELAVVPAFSVTTTPSLAVIPAAAGGKLVEREIHVTVTNSTKRAARATVSLEAPSGWKVVPPDSTLEFAREDESLSARFVVSAPAGVKTGEYNLRAVVTSPDAPGQRFSNGYEPIEYPHVARRQVIKPADTSVKVIDVKTIPNITVGYIVGVGDQVPAALEQLGARVTEIDRDELAWGDLSNYDVIITGVRAYERRADLRAYNRRLLEYAERGGTVIVQYNKFEFNQAQYGPFPAQVSSNRVADENAPVKVLVPDHPVFNFPNRIGASTWAGWVQERGLYFLGEKDPRYVDLVSMVDSFKDNPGVKLGALVEGRPGKGRWIYLGLALWRQLPAGTDGAYQLLANLISLPKAPAVASH